MNDRLKDILIRAAKTFLQAFLATATVQLMAIAGSGSMKVDVRSLAVTVGIPAMAAGFSAIQNALFPPSGEPPAPEKDSGIYATVVYSETEETDTDE